MDIKALKFEIRDGVLRVSYDNGCTWEPIGNVIGEQGVQGEEGPQGEKGEDGVNGENGQNAKNPYIDPTTGHWMVYLDENPDEAVDTGVVAAGANGTIRIASSADIGEVGTPAVTEEGVIDGTLYIAFHKLKGAKGDDGKDGVVYTEGTHISIVTPEQEEGQPVEPSTINCTLSEGDDITIDASDKINVTNPYESEALPPTAGNAINDYGVRYKQNPISAIYSVMPQDNVSLGAVSYAGVITPSENARYIILCAAGTNSNSWASTCLHITADYQGTGKEVQGNVGVFVHPTHPANDGVVRTTFPWKVFVTTEEDAVSGALIKRLYLEVPASFNGTVCFWASAHPQGYTGRYLDAGTGAYKRFEDITPSVTANTPLLTSLGANETIAEGLDIQRVMSMTVGTGVPTQPTVIEEHSYLIEALLNRLSTLEEIVQQILDDGSGSV